MSGKHWGCQVSIGVSGEHWGVRWGQMSIGRVSGGVSEHWRGCQVGSGEQVL